MNPFFYSTSVVHKYTSISFVSIRFEIGAWLFIFEWFCQWTILSKCEYFSLEMLKIISKDAKNASRLFVFLFDYIFQEKLFVERIDYTGEFVNRKQFNQFIAYHIIHFIQKTIIEAMYHFLNVFPWKSRHQSYFVNSFFYSTSVVHKYTSISFVNTRFEIVDWIFIFEWIC